MRYWARFDAKDLEALRPGPAVQGLGDLDQAVVVIVGAEAAVSKAGPSARGPVAASARPDGEGQGDGSESPAGAASRRPR